MDTNGLSKGDHNMEHEEPINTMVDLTMSDAQNWSSECPPPGGNDPTPGKLFVGGLSWQTTTDKLKEYFGIFGTVDEVVIMMDPVTQRSRGFGFVTFTDPDTVEKVLKVPIHTLDGKKIDPKCATPKIRGKGGGNRTKKIFVGGISQDTTSEEVKEYFSQFGRVQECVMLMDQQTRRHRGFGFVIFDCEEVVDQVCEIHFHTIKNKKVECKKAQTKEAIQSDLQKNPTSSAGHSGGPPPPPPPLAAASQLAAVQAQAYLQAAIAAIAAQAQSAALGGNGKFFGAHPGMGSFRYAPYPMPGGLGGLQQAAAALGASTVSQSSATGAGNQQLRPGAVGPRGMGGARQGTSGGGGNPSLQRGTGGVDASQFRSGTSGPGGMGDARRAAGSLGSSYSQLGNMGAGMAGRPMNNPYQGNNMNMGNFPPGIDLESMFGMGM